jgi:NAD(P)-dependent dehydrogenase (short-subunit alcohol dehydrogenase family)
MKTAIVTGASGNMGRAIVRKFLDKNYRVIGTIAVNEHCPIDIQHANFEKKEVDLLSEKGAAAFVSEVIEKYSCIDTVVLTVGGFAMGTIANTDTAAILKQVDLNFSTTYNIARPVFLHMLQQGHGRIFMTGSRPGLHSFHGSGMIAYSLGKSLLFRLADLMNDEAKGKDVVTSIIVPSTIDTPQNRQAMPDVDPVNWVKPEEIASIIHYHSSDDARPLRETVIKVYGNS